MCRRWGFGRGVFLKLQIRSAATWNTLIGGYADAGLVEEALSLFRAMQQERIEPTDVSYVIILKACSSTMNIGIGLRLHGCYSEDSTVLNVQIGNTLIDLYANCGQLDDALSVFHAYTKPSLVTWNALILGYSKQYHTAKALHLFQRMQDQWGEPDTYTIVSALKACSRGEALEDGMLLHAFVIEKASGSESFVGNALITLYANCARNDDAFSVFDKLQERSVTTWNTLIGVFADLDLCEKAMDLFKGMQKVVEPNSTTFLSVLKACANLAALDEGRRIHTVVAESHCEMEVDVGTSLLDMYGKCGSLNDAWQVFNRLPKQSVITWNAMIGAYAENGHGQDALCTFQKMQELGLKPSNMTYLSILKASPALAIEHQGKLIHTHLMESNCGMTAQLSKALVCMYQGYGFLEDASNVLYMSQEECIEAPEGLLNWLHRGYQSHMSQFDIILQGGLRPEDRMLSSAVCESTHCGLADEACYHNWKPFMGARNAPMPESYGHIGGLFARTGHLREAESLLETMPLSCDLVSWTSLLGYCRFHGSVDAGEQCLERLSALDFNHAAACSMLVTCTAVSRWGGVDWAPEPGGFAFD